MSKSRNFALMSLLFSALIWGFAGVVIKFTLTDFPPLIFLIYRLGISALIALPFLGGNKLFHKSARAHWPAIILYSLLAVTGALSFLFLGLEKTTVLTLSLITIVSPLLLVLVSIYFLKERIGEKKKIGIAIAFLGAFLTVVEPILKNSMGVGEFSGNMLLILSTLTSVASVIVLKRLMQDGISPFFITNLSFVIGFFTTLPIVLLYYSPAQILQSITNDKPAYQLGILYMAIFSGTIAYTLSTMGVKTLKVSETSVFTYLQSIFAISFAVVLLHESPTPLFILGGAIVIIGVLIAELGKNFLKT